MIEKPSKSSSPNQKSELGDASPTKEEESPLMAPIKAPMSEEEIEAEERKAVMQKLAKLRKDIDDKKNEEYEKKLKKEEKERQK